MTSLTKFYLIALCLALTLADCSTKKPDDDVLITYQHLGNFESWNLKGKGNTEQPTGMWHVYMLRGIVNKGKDAQPFVFDLTKLTTNTGATVKSEAVAMANADPYTLPANFTTTVNPNVAFNVPFGTGALFFIKQANDKEQTAMTHLFYKTIGADGKPKIQEGVIMHMLDAKAPVMYGHLDIDFLEELHSRQNKFENDYEPGGHKK